MKQYLLAGLLIASTPVMAAIHCGHFTVQPDRYRTMINGDRMLVTETTFRGAPRDYSWATITLLPESITTKNRLYQMRTEGGNATLELTTTENPPRVLNRERCDAGLEAFNW